MGRPENRPGQPSSPAIRSGSRIARQRLNREKENMDTSPTVIEFPLSNGGTTRIDASDLPAVSSRKWAKQQNGGSTYVRATSKPRVYLHQFLVPTSASVDHIDRDGLNNCRSNLRAASSREQTLNRRRPKHGKSPYRGVHFDAARKKWVASVGSRPRHYQGRFDFVTEAALAYDRGALRAYGNRAQLNFPRGNQTGLPTLLFVGWGRAGKDEAAHYLSTITKLRYTGSFSWNALPFMADFLGLHPQQAWDTRHQHRQVWKDRLDYLRTGDESFLAEMSLSTGEVSAGLRDRIELESVRAKKLFTRIIWIQRPVIPTDPTVTFSSKDCDLVINNDGTLEDFHIKLRDLSVSLGLPLK